MAVLIKKTTSYETNITVFMTTEHNLKSGRPHLENIWMRLFQVFVYFAQQAYLDDDKSSNAQPYISSIFLW